MRLVLILSLILMFTFQSALCQVIDEQNKKESPQELFDLYTYKQKQNRNTGWILLGAGAVLITGGILTGEQDTNSIGEAVAADISGSILAIAGGATAVASIPFFIIASKHKQRANLALKGETITLNSIPITKSNYLVFSLTIALDN